MNILIPHSWLKEHLETKATPKQIAKSLSLCSQSVEKIITTNQDSIYEIEITTNRPDCLSIYGIARELAVILPRFDIPAKLKKIPETKIEIPQPGKTLPLKVKIEEASLCPRFTAIIFDNITIKPSPKIIQKRLKEAGIRSLNNVVDISNYLMLELGQPMHTFDYDKIKGNKMILREAVKGEKITTLDGKTRLLPEGTIIIEDGEKRIIDLCGIMGGKNSEVDENTKRVLLFVQTYDPVKIRQTCQKLAFRTEAASRFEKGVDPEGVLIAIKKAVKMFRKNCGAKVASKLIDIYPSPQKKKLVKLDLDLVEKKIGAKIPKKVSIQILNSLGFQAADSDSKGRSSTFSVPFWRHGDISIPEDLIEEIARIYGYHKIPNTLLEGEIPVTGEDPVFFWEEKIKDALKYWGFTETVNYSMIGKKILKKSNLDYKGLVKIKNPLTKKLVYMRPSLIPSLLKVVARNQRRIKLINESDSDEIKVFELANAYFPNGKNKLPDERLTLAVIMEGGKFYQLKGVLENILKEMAIKDIMIKPTKSKINNSFNSVRAAEIGTRNNYLGIIGEINSRVVNAFKIKGKVTALEVNFSQLVKMAKKSKKYQPISKYPPIVEDLSFNFPPKTLTQDVIETIKGIDPIIKDVKLLDSYRESKTFRITYQDPNENLTSKKVKEIKGRIIEKVENKFSASLRGKLED